MESQPLSSPVALLGVTGNTGQVVLRNLLEREQSSLRIYARSQEKLLHIFPGLDTNPKVRLYIGSTSDLNLMRNLFAGVGTIISTLGSNDFAPVTVQRVAAQSIVAALQDLQANDKSWQKPRLLWLSSSTMNTRFAAARPPLVHWLIETAFDYGYEDLRSAQDTILAEEGLASVLLIQPGVLVDEPGSGFEISVDSVKLAASYEDLGAAFVELALNPNYVDLHQVGVSSRLGDRGPRYAPIILFRLTLGFIAGYTVSCTQRAHRAGVVCPGIPAVERPECDRRDPGPRP